MNRRDMVFCLVALVAEATNRRAEAQQPEKIRRIGILLGSPATDTASQSRLAAFKNELKTLGWHEGQNLRVDVRFSDDASRVTVLAKEVVALQPDVIVSSTAAVSIALYDATRGIPIVFASVGDPIGCGLVESLSRPGGNATGFTDLEPSMIEKWLQLLKEMAPSIKRVAVAYNIDAAPYYGAFLLPATAVARTVGVSAFPVPVRSFTEIEELLIGSSRQPDMGLVVAGDDFMDAHRESIIAAASRQKVPVMYSSSINVEEGGLMSYGIAVEDLYRRAAHYVDRLLRGAKPSELPVQLPVKFELAVNRKTAAALGLAIPLSIQLRADAIVD